MSSVEFSRAKVLYRNWKAKLRGFLNGENSLTNEEAFDPKACPLGKWIYGEGMGNYSRDHDMLKLEKIHAKMHARVKDYTLMKDSGNDFGVQRDREKIEALSYELMNLLDALEKKHKGS